MFCSFQGFDKIQTLGSLQSLLNTPLDESEWGILALDLDQTLIQAKPTLGDEHFYRFLVAQNSARGIPSDAHYQWTVKIRSNIQYESCEAVEKINQIIQCFKNQSWSVQILTSRGVDMKEITEKHLEQSKINLSIEDVIFKERHGDGTGKLLKKDESLQKWMSTQPHWKNKETFRIIFLDDSEKYCNEVARVAEGVKKASVRCFHYIGSLPCSELSEAQMKQLIVQLHAYREGQSIPYEYDSTQLEKAKGCLGIDKIDAETLYTVMMKIAELECFAFQ